MPTFLCSLAVLGLLQTPVAPAPELPHLALIRTLGYRVNSVPGQVSVDVPLESGKRSQRLYCSPIIDEYGQAKTWYLTTLFHTSETSPSDDFLRGVLRERFNQGGIRYQKPKESQKLWRFFYRVSLPPNVLAEDLKLAVEATAMVADDLEKKYDDPKADRF